MNNNQITELVASLSCDAVDCKPIEVDWRETLGHNMDGWQSFEAVECDDCGHVHVLGPFGESRCNDEMPEVETDGDSKPNECEGWLNSNGPSMNYFYPVRISDCEKAARNISGSLCVVELADGITGVALTGGGMDFSWEICQAFIDIGFLPPAHFAGNLPEMAGFEKDPRTPLVLAAARVSCEVALGWARRRLDNVTRMQERVANKE